MKRFILACAALLLIVAAMVAINGPYHEQERVVSGCDLEARRFYLTHPGVADDAAIARDVQLCMKTKGFRPSSACPPHRAQSILEQARTARCYVPQGGVRRLIFFAEERIRNP